MPSKYAILCTNHSANPLPLKHPNVFVNQHK